MRPNSRLLLSLVSLLTLLTAAAYAQKRMCPKPPPSPFKHDGQIITSFDSRAGGMRTTLQHPRPLVRGAEVYYLAATFMHQDPRRPAVPPTLDLILVSATPAAGLRAGQQLAFVLDGQTRSFGQNVSYRSQPTADGTTLESARITLSYAEASALTRARRVAARVGGTEVELTNNHLEALREIVSLMAPSPSRWQTDALSSAR
ncbi:MAG: hypothetical protein DMF67_05580 [Acidobacteria bacterium]|nr:MAG: hypothetical protein DMF67_05580 [Acidobacteriota bacterium]